MENHRGTDRPEIEPRLELALRESWNKSFQLFHAAARSTPKDGIAEAIRKLDLPILSLRYAINNPLSPCTDRTPRKSISLSYRRREGESAARLANNSKIRWLWPITTTREWLIYAGVIKRISYTAGRRNKSGRPVTRERASRECYSLSRRFRGDKRHASKVMLQKPRACTAPCEIRSVFNFIAKVRSRKRAHRRGAKDLFVRGHASISARISARISAK